MGEHFALTNGNRLSDDDDFVFISRAGKIRNDHVAFNKALIRMIEKAKV
ncbi:hypothetical protein [Virgibacillus dokdonensis]|nr:hypothetical protein [Virgibacillus dokdonensis]